MGSGGDFALFETGGKVLEVQVDLCLDDPVEIGIIGAIRGKGKFHHKLNIRTTYDCYSETGNMIPRFLGH